MAKEYQDAYRKTPKGKTHNKRKRHGTWYNSKELGIRQAIESAENEGMPPKRAARGKTGPRIDPSCSCEGCEYYRFLKALMVESGRTPVLVR